MLKRMLALAAVLLVVLVPAAVAANGAPPKPSHPNASGSDAQGPGQRTSSREQKLAAIRQRIQKAAAGFDKHCASQHADVEKCTAAAEKLLAGLKKVDEKIDALVAKIHERCDASKNPGNGTDGCAHADQLVKKLGDVQAQIQRVEEKLAAWLEQRANDSSATDSSASESLSLESIQQLQTELAKLEAAGQRL